MTTQNPIFKHFPAVADADGSVSRHGGRATLQGVARKTLVLLAVFSVAAAAMWVEHYRVARMSNSAFLLVAYSVLAASICGFLLLWVVIRKSRLSALVGVLFSVLEGAVIGFLSTGSNPTYSRIGVQTVCSTVIISLCLLGAYRMKLITAAAPLPRKVAVITAGALLYYVAWFVLIAVGMNVVSTLTGIAISVVATMCLLALAALSLVSGFDAAVECSESGLPRYLEWYVALGLVVSLFWLYIEVLVLGIDARTQRRA